MIFALVFEFILFMLLLSFRCLNLTEKIDDTLITDIHNAFLIILIMAIMYFYIKAYMGIKSYYSDYLRNNEDEALNGGRENVEKALNTMKILFISISICITGNCIFHVLRRSYLER